MILVALAFITDCVSLQAGDTLSITVAVAFRCGSSKKATLLTGRCPVRKLGSPAPPQAENLQAAIAHLAEHDPTRLLATPTLCAIAQYGLDCTTGVLVCARITPPSIRCLGLRLSGCCAIWVKKTHLDPRRIRTLFSQTSRQPDRQPAPVLGGAHCQ